MEEVGLVRVTMSSWRRSLLARLGPNWGMAL